MSGTKKQSSQCPLEHINFDLQARWNVYNITFIAWHRNFSRLPLQVLCVGVKKLCYLHFNTFNFDAPGIGGFVELNLFMIGRQVVEVVGGWYSRFSLDGWVGLVGWRWMSRVRNSSKNTLVFVYTRFSGR